MHKIGQSGGFSGRLLGPLGPLGLQTGLPFMKNVLKPQAKSVLIPSGLTAVASATDAAIQKKMFESDITTVNYTMKIVKPVEESGLLIKVVSETIKNEAKVQKEWFLSM